MLVLVLITSGQFEFQRYIKTYYHQTPHALSTRYMALMSNFIVLCENLHFWPRFKLAAISYLQVVNLETLTLECIGNDISRPFMFRNDEVMTPLKFRQRPFVTAPLVAHVTNFFSFSELPLTKIQRQI